MSTNIVTLADRRTRRVDPNPPTDPDHTADVVPITGRAVYTVEEVAHLLSLSRGSTYTLVRTGQIPALKLGGRWVIPKRRLHAWLDNLPTVEPTSDIDDQARADCRALRRPS